MSHLKEPFVLPGHKMTKAFGDLRFRFYPCGYKASDFNTMIYVAYKSTMHQNFDKPGVILETDADSVHFDFPDREILFTKQGRMVDGDRPFNRPRHEQKWHKAVALSVASATGDDFPFDRYMINPHAFSANNEPRVRDKSNNATTDKVVISDSGGFQLGHGSVGFIHPNELAEFYNRNADEGMTLDIPARALGDHDILKYTAKVQNLNSKYMLERLKPGFRFGQVVHGLSLDRIDQFRQDTEIFDDGVMPIMSISGSLRFNIMESIHRILHIILTGKRYEQYHILGVSNPPFYAAVIRMSYLLKKLGINVLVTADSSSPIAFSLKHTYYSQRVFYEGLIPTRFGTKMSSNQDAPAADVSNPHRKLASSDVLSQIIGGYQDIISSYNVNLTQSYLMYMNQMEMCRYVNQMCLYADELDHFTYKALVKEQYSKSNHSHILSATLDYLEYFFENGIDKAFHKFRFYMPQFSHEASMHKFPAMEENEEMIEESANFDMNRKRLISVIKGYLQFHKTGKVPKGMNKKEPEKAMSSLKIRL